MSNKSALTVDKADVCSGWAETWRYSFLIWMVTSACWPIPVEKTFNNQVDKLIYSMDASQPLSPAIPKSSHVFVHKVPIVTRMEAMHGPINMNFHSPGHPD
jgi:hypothetical protein